MTPGYSGTPLLKKLGIKPDYICTVINPPTDYFEWLGELPPDSSFKVKSELYDFIHWFIKSEEELSENLNRLTATLKPTGMIWVSWPKGTSNIPTDINRDKIRTHLLQNSDLVDVKVCAVSDDWSGLKFMIRKEKR